MIYQVTLPHPALRPYVKEYLLIDFDFTGLAEIPTRLMPVRAEQSLIFYPGAAFTKVDSALNKRLLIPRAVVQGQPLTVWHHHYPRTFCLVKVVFQPGGLYHLLGAPLSEFTDAAVDAEAVLGRHMYEVLQQLMDAARYQEMIEVVEAYLLNKFRRSPPRPESIDRLGQLLQAAPQPANLDYLASQACLSFRQFERKFRERLGISPKLFMRIQRFNRALDAKEKHPARDWLSIALACGYADYQHMVKDFKQFGGATPVGLLQAAAQSPERLLHLR